MKSDFYRNDQKYELDFKRKIVVKELKLLMESDFYKYLKENIQRKINKVVSLTE
jgi:hypothetical protein